MNKHELIAYLERQRDESHNMEVSTKDLEVRRYFHIKKHIFTELLNVTKSSDALEKLIGATRYYDNLLMECMNKKIEKDHNNWVKYEQRYPRYAQTYYIRLRIIQNVLMLYHRGLKERMYGHKR